LHPPFFFCAPVQVSEGQHHITRETCDTELPKKQQ
jgi:hypothetical protein